MPKSKLAPHHIFIARIKWSLGVAFILICIALFVGVLGYHYIEGFTWIDSFANAAMILSGMGPLEKLATDGGKIFAGFYALFSGLLFILIIGLILAPIMHRFFHKFRIEDEG